MRSPQTTRSCRAPTSTTEQGIVLDRRRVPRGPSGARQLARWTPHAPIRRDNPFTEAHFRRCLDLLTTTVDEHFSGRVADAAKQRAAKMARALQRLLGGRDEAADRPIEARLTAIDPAHA